MKTFFLCLLMVLSTSFSMQMPLQAMQKSLPHGFKVAAGVGLLTQVFGSLVTIVGTNLAFTNEGHPKPSRISSFLINSGTYLRRTGGLLALLGSAACFKESMKTGVTDRKKQKLRGIGFATAFFSIPIWYFDIWTTCANRGLIRI